MDYLRFYVLFIYTSVISERWKRDYEREGKREREIYLTVPSEQINE